MSNHTHSARAMTANPLAAVALAAWYSVDPLWPVLSHHVIVTAPVTKRAVPNAT